MKCSICGSAATTALPVPHPTQSIISDGPVAPMPLHKMSCNACGAVSHVQPLDFDSVRAFYASNYDLGFAPTSFDVRRGTAYAGLIQRFAGHLLPSDVLEVGCGTGIVLDALSKVWPHARMTGLEAAKKLAIGPAAPNVVILNCYLEDYTAQPASLDLVFAINVVEHSAAPQQFLARITELLKPDGLAVFVFPSERPNIELLFLDHIQTFTPRALSVLAARAGLDVIESADLGEGMGDFQYSILTHAKAQLAAQAKPTVGAEQFDALTHQRIDYLAAWQRLDGALLARLTSGNPILAFGAGEAAALLRAFAPQTWARISRLLVDEPNGARRFGKPTSALAEAGPLSGASLLLATHPRSQAELAIRLASTGADMIVWSDLIAC